MDEKLNKRFLKRLIYFGSILVIGSFTVFVCHVTNFTAFIIGIFVALFPVVLAVFIAYVLEPLIGKLTKWKIPRPLSVVIIYLLFFALLIFLGFIIFPTLTSQIKDFFTKLPQLLDNINEAISAVTINLPFEINLKELTDIYFQTFVDGLFNFSIKLIDSLFGIAIAITGAIFLSLDFILFRKSIKKLVPSKYQNSIYKFFATFLPQIHRYVVGILIDNILFFILASLIFYLSGAEFPLLFGLIIALTNFIPIIGPYIGGIPIVLIGFTTSLNIGLLYLGIVVILQFFESNIMQPLILKNTIKTEPFEQLIGIAIFGQMFGVIGMIASPILITAIKIGISQYNEQKQEKEEITNK